jgi:hypothetical protein
MHLISWTHPRGSETRSAKTSMNIVLKQFLNICHNFQGKVNVTNNFAMAAFSQH